MRTGILNFGSGFLYQNNNGISVVTNKHVITDANGNAPTTCSVEIPGDGSNSYTVAGTFTKISTDGYDWGVIPITDGDVYLNSIAKANLPLCQTQEQTGDSVVILGYPDYAGQFTEPTATTGIISGYASPYYTTSTQLESGNSGGVAIDPDKDCYIGIPSAVKTGNYANLGRILSAGAVFKLSYTPVMSNDQICQKQYGTNSVYSGQTNSQGGLICSCASGYTWNTGQTACVVVQQTNDQICQNNYGSYSQWSGTTNAQGSPNCICQVGYAWNGTGTTCVTEVGLTQYCQNNFGFGSYSIVQNGKSICACMTGYTLNSSQTACILAQPNCPLFSTYNSVTYKCDCDSGYIPVGNTCESGYVACTSLEGYGATFNSLTGQCACLSGYVYNGSQCVSGYIYCSERWGTGAIYDYATGLCACTYGYESNGTQCIYTGY